MWLDARLPRLLAPDRPTVLEGGDAYGAPFLVQALRERADVAWLELSPSEAGDAVAIGNLLAGALNAALSGRSFALALPYEYHLQTLRQHPETFRGLVVAVGDAQLDPAFAEAVASLHRDDLWVLLTVEGRAPAGLDAHVLTREELRLSPQEALGMAPRSLEDARVAELHAAADGAYTRFCDALSRATDFPPLRIPGPERDRVPIERARLEEPRDVVRALSRAGRPVEALELAVLEAQEEVETVLRRAGPAYQERGLLARLHLLLSALRPPFDRTEGALEWRLVASFSLGRSREVAQDVREYLAAFEAPALRARFAALLPLEEGLREARRALAAARTPLTLWQLGRLHPDHAESVALLRESVRQAEDDNDAYGRVRAAGALATRLLHLGDVTQAVTWARYALDTVDREGLLDGQRRLRLLNAFASARILLGDTAGLRSQLEDAQGALENAVPGLASVFRGTLAELELAGRRPRVALELARANYEVCQRVQKGRFALPYLRALQALGRRDEARMVGEEALHLAGDGDGPLAALARLAHGMVLADTDPEGALEVLAPAANDPRLPFEHRAAAALCLLALDGRVDGAAAVPPELAAGLDRLPDAGLRALCGGEEELGRALARLGRHAPVLELQVLGRSRAVLQGETLKLSRRLWEVLTVLALHPEGLSNEELHAFLAGDDGTVRPSTLRSHVSRLRAMLPIAEGALRLDLPYRLDLQALRERLAVGDAAGALALYEGPLLPGASLPGIEALRGEVEAEVRAVALGSHDGDVLFELAERLGDDLEAWEAAVAALAPGDPRYALALTRVRRLQEDYGLPQGADPPRA